jgi:hypothetical protein
LPEAPAALALTSLTLGALAGLLLVGGTVLVRAVAVPDRVAWPAFTATGTFGLAALVLLHGGSLPVAVAGTVAALVAWDAGEYATTLRAEAGRGRATRAELVHLGGSGLVGLASLLGVALLSGAVGALSPGEALPAFAVALLLALAAGAAVLFVLDG